MAEGTAGSSNSNQLYSAYEAFHAEKQKNVLWLALRDTFTEPWKNQYGFM